MNNLVITSFTTLGNGISNYTAQNIGAGKLSRIQSGFKAGLKIVWMLCVPISLLYVLGAKQLVYAFLDAPTADALQTGVEFLRILAPFYFIVAAKLVSDGILRGSGMMKQFMIGTFTDLQLRVAQAKLLAGTPLGSTGIWCAWPIAWVVGTVLSVLFYRRGQWFSSETE